MSEKCYPRVTANIGLGPFRPFFVIMTSNEGEQNSSILEKSNFHDYCNEVGKDFFRTIKDIILIIENQFKKEMNGFDTKVEMEIHFLFGNNGAANYIGGWFALIERLVPRNPMWKDVEFVFHVNNTFFPVVYRYYLNKFSNITIDPTENFTIVLANTKFDIQFFRLSLEDESINVTKELLGGDKNE